MVEACAALSAATATVALLGWLLDLELLRSVFPGSVAMNPMTAACFLLSAAALFLSARDRPRGPRARGAAAACAGLAAALGLLRLLDYLLGWGWSVDRLLLPSRLGDNAMAPNTALDFTLAGAALLLLDAPRGGRLVQPACGVVLLTAFLAFVGHMVGAEGLYRPLPAIGMAANTAFAFLALGLGILAARPERGLAARVSSSRPGGAMARRLLPAAVGVPLVLGWLRLWGERRGLYGEEFGLGLMVLASAVLLAALTLRTAAAINASDAERERAQEGALRAAALEAANRELEAFSYSVSHDLRAPLRHIDGYIELLTERAAPGLDHEGRRYLEVISGSARRMGALIDDLLAFARMARAPMTKAPVPLGDLVAEARSELAPEAAGRVVEWRVGELPAAECDRAMLKLVFANVLGNALKFTRHRERAVIEVGARRDGPGRVTVFVRDNGAGFDMAYRDKLFGVFQRLHRQEEFEGTGVGLASVRRIIRRHGGEAWAEGEPGKGATFYFSLPGKEGR